MEEEEGSDDNCNYTELTIAQLLLNSRQVLGTIKGCKAVVKHVNKVRDEVEYIRAIRDFGLG